MQNRQHFLDNYSQELSAHLGRSEEQIKHKGLNAGDFPYTVEIQYEDGSYAHYKHAFFVEGFKNYAIFTEHCGYHEIFKLSLESIKQH